MTRRIFWQWPLLLTTGLGIAQAGAAATAPEYQVKAAFIYKFTTYIRWPAPVGGNAARPFVIGVIGKDPFGPLLAAVVREQSVQGRAIRVKTLSRIEEALECDLVFVSSSERGNLGQIFSLLHGASVLTVGDMDQFAEQGGMIGLVTTEDNHVRFDINRAAIERSGLRASSQLLHLARIIDEPREDGGHR
ncbi:MAG TPA: YfiR family protein [Thermoanaerobaculia bacterium]|nr:YfiR family protein [Thermoanaerobaculia bacterium]